MKIGLVRRGFSLTGGAEAYLLRLAHGLHGLGHDLSLITDSAWPEKAWPYGSICRIRGGTPTTFASAVSQVRDQVDLTVTLDRTPGCDIFRAGDGVHAAWLRRRAEFEPAWRSLIRRWTPKHGALVLLERRVFETTPCLIANSRMVAREIGEWYGVGEERVHVIPNGVAMPDVLADRKEARAHLSLDPEVFVLLFLGSGWERKGLRFAIEAVSRCKKPPILLVAGRGRRPRQSAPTERYLGPRKDLPTLFAASDALVLPTLYDPFSNACLEALAAGLPVITTSANGFSEIIDEGIHGSIVNPGDTDALHSAIEFWQGRAQPTSTCRARASEYSLERNLKTTEKLILSQAG